MATEARSAERGAARRAQRREQILAAAERLLVDNGVERTRLRDVAAAACTAASSASAGRVTRIWLARRRSGTT